MTDLIREAREFARKAHAGQRRKDEGGRPYILHPAEVAALAQALGAPDPVVAAAWLHDTIEDCAGVDLPLIAGRFGAEVAAMVAELSDDKALPKARRKALQVETAPLRSPGAALVKVCDKMSNVRSVALTPPKDWSAARRAGYLDWAQAVVDRLPDLPAAARAAFALDLAMARNVLAAAI